MMYRISDDLFFINNVPVSSLWTNLMNINLRNLSYITSSF
jgi:hypothetical protein